MAIRFNNSEPDSQLILSLLEEKVKDGGDILSLGDALNKRTELQLVVVVNWTSLNSKSCELMMDDSYIALYLTGPEIEKVMINLSLFYTELESIIGNQALSKALLKYNNTKIE